LNDQAKCSLNVENVSLLLLLKIWSGTWYFLEMFLEMEINNTDCLFWIFTILVKRQSTLCFAVELTDELSQL